MQRQSQRLPVLGPDTAARPDPPSDLPGAGVGLKSLLETARLVVAPTTLLTALLFYFGWVFTDARTQFFGIDPSTLGYSTQDYILRSADPVFLPVCGLLILGVVLMWAHSALVGWIAAGKHHRGLTAAFLSLVSIGAALLLNGLLGLVLGDPPVGGRGIVAPLGLGAGVGLIAYGLSLWDRLHPDRAGGSRSNLGPASVTVVALLMVVSLFAGVGEWAHSIGVRRAIDLAGHMDSRLPGVAVYSKARLQIDAVGVRVTTVGDAESEYRFRYTGLKLLIRSGGKYFLLPVGWSRSEGVAIVLPERDDLRFEFMPH